MTNINGPAMTDPLHRLLKEQRLPPHYLEDVRACYLPLAAGIAQKRQGLDRPLTVSIHGPQGSGKSTLSRVLGLLLEQHHGLRPVILSLDDFYLTRRQRLERARRIHPLFATRGVPGTHDEALATDILDALRGGDFSAPLRLPRFDKARDERLPLRDWPSVEAPVDVILFEGWCNHCPPQGDAALENAVNALEREEDPDGQWRRSVNEFLRDYRLSLFRPVDLLLYLRIPSFDKVLEWRGLQERKLRQRLGQGVGMDEAALRRFIQHYERLTRHGMAVLPEIADTVIDLDERHRVSGWTQKGSP